MAGGGTSIVNARRASGNTLGIQRARRIAITEKQRIELAPGKWFVELDYCRDC